MSLSKLFVAIFLVLLTFILFSEESIEDRIKRLASDVAEIAQKELGVKDRLALLQKRALLSKATIEKLKKEKEVALKDLDKLKMETEEVKREENQIFSYLKKRIKIIYISGFLNEYRVLFSTESGEDFLQVNSLLNSLNLKDMKEIEKLKNLSREKKEKEKELKERIIKIEDIERESALEREKLNEEITMVSKILQDISKNSEMARKNLAETIENARKMDLYFKDLNFKNGVEMYGQNILLYKGKLPKPLKGRIVKGFGDYVHPKFKTKLPHPGVDFEAPYGSLVSSIFDGEVVFADWLSGYGYTVIVNHPQGFYSLYSHLDKIDVKKGDILKREQKLGLSGGDPTKNFTGIYFELRQGKTAVDPALWIKE